jgi:DNA-binding NarL/FixJ family response regulator
MRALVIDDHPLIQEAVSHVLQRIDDRFSTEVAGDCERGFTIASAGDELDLVLLDMNLPGLSGIPALRQWRARFPSIPVVVLSATSDPHTVMAALNAGAAGFIPKMSSNAVMLHAIQLVLDGGRYIPPEALSRSSENETATVQDRSALALDTLGLTARQIDVLRLIADGAPNKVICRELGLAERTVKAHVTAVFRALKVTSRTQAAIAAAKLGLTQR